VLLVQRNRKCVRAREKSAALVDRVAGIGVGDGVLAALGIGDDERKGEDRLLAPEGRDHLGARIEGRAEAALGPAGDRLAQLGETDRGRVAHPLAQPVDERTLDHRIGGLPGVAHAEVEHRHAALGDPPRRFVQAHERVGRLPLEDGGDGHGRTLPVTKAQSASNVRSSSAISTRSSRRWA
jgi:hypothetical protein